MQSEDPVGGAGRREGQDHFFQEEPFPAHGTVTEGLAEPQVPRAPARQARRWNRPILVTGAPRSGTTWVGRMIASHPRVAYLAEPFNVEQLAGVPATHFFHAVTDRDAAAFRGYLDRLLRFRAAPLPHLRWNFLHWLSRLAVRYLRLARYRLGSYRPLMKDPLAFFSAEWLARTFAMDVVVLVRHPAAFAGSAKRLGWGWDFQALRSQPALLEQYLGEFAEEIRRQCRAPGDVIDQAILLWRIVHAVVRRYQAAHPDWTFVRHEDLSRRPVEEFARLLPRLGLQVTGRVLRVIEEHSSPANPPEADEGVHHQLKLDSRANVWSWRYRLTPEEVLRVKRGTEDVAPYFYADQDW